MIDLARELLSSSATLNVYARGVSSTTQLTPWL